MTRILGATNLLVLTIAISRVTATGLLGAPASNGNGGLLGSIAGPQATSGNGPNGTSLVSSIVNATESVGSIAQDVAPAIASPQANQTAAASTQNVTVTNTTAAPGNLTAASNAPATGVCVSQCVRKEWRSLSKSERDAFIRAVKKLQAGPSPTQYDRFVKMHIDDERFAHGTPYFAPYHRAYLREFERALQAVEPGVCLPYWNWALDSQSAENAPLFTPEYFGTTTQGCIADGAFANYQAAYPSPHCVMRQYDGGNSVSALPSVEAVNRVVTSSADYDTFRSRCENVLHPHAHINIGGDFATMHSPNDCLFWLHHAYVDFIWTRWQQRNGFDFNGPNANRNEPLRSLSGYTVDSVMDHRKLCYDYADLAESDLAEDRLPPPAVPRPSEGNRPDHVNVVEIPADENMRWNSLDRSSLNTLRFPRQVPDEWCAMNHADVTVMRKYEEEYRGVYRQLNSIKGYMSPCCLWKRPSLCRPLVGKVPKFCVDVHGYGRMEITYEDPDPSQCLANVCQRASYTNADVELPPESYRAEVQKLIGASAFNGAGSMKPITDMDSIAGAAKNGAMLGAAVAAAVAIPAVLSMA